MKIEQKQAADSVELHANGKNIADVWVSQGDHEDHIFPDGRTASDYADLFTAAPDLLAAAESSRQTLNGLIVYLKNKKPEDIDLDLIKDDITKALEIADAAHRKACPRPMMV